MGFFNKELKELFDFSSKERPKVVADEIQAGVEEAGKGRGLGVQTKKRKQPNFSLSDAGQNLYKDSFGASEEALAKQEQIRKDIESQSITNILSAIMKDTENETQKYLPKGDTLGEATYLTPEEQKQRSIVDYTVTKEKPEFKASGLNIEQSYKNYAKGGSKAIADYNPNYGIDATKAATPFTHITFHHTASKRGASETGVVASGQRSRYYPQFIKDENGNKIKNPKAYDEDGKLLPKVQGGKRDMGQLGYHFYIGRDLKIRQGAPLNKRTNHIGGTNRYFERANKKDKTFTKEQALELLRNQKTAFNENSIGIGIVAADDSDVSSKQIDVAMELTEALSNQFKINPENVGGHGHLDNQDKQLTEGTKATVAWRKLKELSSLNAKFLQQGLGGRTKSYPAVSKEDVLAFQRKYPELVNDGDLGPKTKAMMEKVGYFKNE